MNLGRPDRSALRDALAAEYALGTLSSRARRRLARIALAEPLVQQAIVAWETRLASLAESIPAITPPERVWDGIRTRLRLPGAPGTETKAPTQSWWTSIGLWRGLATAGFALAFALAITLLTPRAPSEAIVVVLAASDNKPALVATAERNARYLTIKPVAAIAIAADRTLELWSLPPGGNPRSMGLISASGIARVPLAAPAGTALQDIPALAVSLEPSGGSPTGQPTGPVLYSGGVQRLY
jgi:anti-sigma-K factor RskA